MNERYSLDTICASLAYAMGITPPQQAAEPCAALCSYADKALSGRKADRVFLFNPDAIAQWVYEKYPELTEEVTAEAEQKIELCSVMPSVTPVCFGTLYTGAQPEVHGIRSYKKPVITIDTLFDALLRAGKRPAIVADAGSSMSRIFLERDMDYFVMNTVEQVNAKAAELILRDEHDFIAVYNSNYDAVMHRVGPEGLKALGELRANSRTFGMFAEMIREHWKSHDTLLGFAMDHGCHEIDGGCGSHGLDMDEDLHIMHLYQAVPSEN